MAQSQRGSCKSVQGRREASLRAKITDGGGWISVHSVAGRGRCDTVVARGWKVCREHGWLQRETAIA